MKIRIAIMVCGAVLASAVGAAAQTWDDRLFLNVSGGVQAGSSTSSLTLTPVVYDEPGSVTVERDIKGGGLFDVAVGRPIQGNLGVMLNVSTRSSKATADLSASIPDPIFFDRPRAASGSIADMEHSERWVGISAAWFVPAGERLDALVFIGPTFVSVKHELVSGVTVTETGGAPTVAPTITSESKTFTGYQLGADLRYMLTDMVGVGGFLRFSGAKGKILDDSEIEVGGFQLGAGLRLKF